MKLGCDENGSRMTDGSGMEERRKKKEKGSIIEKYEKLAKTHEFFRVKSQLFELYESDYFF